VERKNVLKQASTDPFLILKVNSYCHFDIRHLRNIHMARDSRATILLVSLDDCRCFGTVILGNDIDVKEFREILPEKSTGLFNAGIYN